MTEYDQDGFVDETDAEFDAFLDDDSDDASDDLNTETSSLAEPVDEFDLGAGDEDEDEIPAITAEQLLADEKIRERNRRNPARIVDNMHEQIGPRLAAARWAEHLEAERQTSVSETTAEDESERTEAAVERVAEYMQLEDEDIGAGAIDPGDHDAAEEAAQRHASAVDRWRDWCADPNN